MSSAILLLVVSLLLSAFTSGCSNSSATDSESGHAQADLTIINGKEPESLDPASVVGQPDGRIVVSIFEGLTRYDPKDAHPIPALADSWKISHDGRTYIFHIRTNAVWSTGEKITARDVEYSWLRVLNPITAADYAGNLYYLKNAEEYNAGKIKNADEVGVHALSESELKVELVNPTPFFLDLCGTPTLCVVPRKMIEQYGDRWLMARPLSASGTFELVDWRLNDRIRLRKNPRHWGAANTQSEIIDLLPVSNSSTALNMYETKEADVIWDKDLVPSELLDVLRKRPDFHTFNYLGSYFYRYNVTRKPFDDARVRQALALAVDKKRIVERITRGGEEAADHIVPSGIPNYHSPKGLGYNPELARELLADAGYPGGKGFPRFDYLFNNSRDNQKIGVELQEMWEKELGIHLELRSVEWKTWIKSQVELDYSVSKSSWIGDYTDPNTFLDLFTSSNPNNRTGWKNPKYDEILKEANSKTNPDEREKLLQSCEKILCAEEAPIVPLYVYVGYNFFDPEKIRGIWNNVRDEHPLWAIRKIKSRSSGEAR